MFSLRDCLFNKIKLEDPPEKRRNLFLKILRLQDLYGDRVVTIVAEVWLRAKEVANRKPAAHYFCKSIKLRLQEANCWDEPGACQGLSAAEAIAKAFPNDEPLPMFEGPARTQGGEPEPVDFSFVKEAAKRARVNGEL